MRNPLIRRLPRELKSDFGKYVVLLIFITGMIGIVSGMLVASGSMIATYHESFEQYNVEDGNFELAFKADEALLDTLEKEKVTIFENFYLEKETDQVDSTLRIFKNRKEVNKVCLMEGSFPETETEIAIDRTYADNNRIEVGDVLTVGGKDLKVTGLVALSDYSTMHSSAADMMFDAVKFGVAVMTEDGFESFGEEQLHYSYSWQYDTAPADDLEAKEMGDDFLETLSEQSVVTNFLPRYSNQAIQFAGDDLGRDKAMVTVFLYIVVIIIAFIFAITTGNTIAKEAGVIGTLRATGYTRRELLIHYLTMPVLVTLVSAVLGNVLGYTWFKNVLADMYYKSYSLPTYVTRWNGEAFVKTTVIPVLLMIGINFCILADKLSLSPLKFLRRDLSRKQKKKAFRLNTKIGIMKRFRLRIIFQNMPNYIIIIAGVFLANVILLFGLAMPPLLDKYEEDITANMICDHQYILKAPVKTEEPNAEPYCAASLKTIEGKLNSEEVTIYGIVPDSQYMSLDFAEEGVYISNAFAEKFGISEGEEVILKEAYGDREYSFRVQGIQYYPAGIAVFMTQEQFNDTFEYEDDYFNGYFSDRELEDIDEVYIASEITVDDMTKTSRQMEVSMGEMMDLFAGFGIIMFMLIIYLLSKIVIEKNAQSISMTKILGYTEKEITGLYVLTTSIVVIGSLILTIPVVDVLMKYVFRFAFSSYAGWLPYYVPFSVYVKMVAAGVAAYGVIAFMQFRRVKKIPLDIALKNVE